MELSFGIMHCSMIKWKASRTIEIGGQSKAFNSKRDKDQDPTDGIITVISVGAANAEKYHNASCEYLNAHQMMSHQCTNDNLNFCYLSWIPAHSFIFIASFGESWCHNDSVAESKSCLLKLK